MYREMSELLGSHVTAFQAASAAAATIEQVQQQLQQQHEWQQQCIVYRQTQVAVAKHNQEVDRTAILQLQSEVLRCRTLLEAAAAAAAAERQGQQQRKQQQQIPVAAVEPAPRPLRTSKTSTQPGGNGPGEANYKGTADQDEPWGRHLRSRSGGHESGEDAVVGMDLKKTMKNIEEPMRLEQTMKNMEGKLDAVQQEACIAQERIKTVEADIRMLWERRFVSAVSDPAPTSAPQPALRPFPQSVVTESGP